MGNIMSKNTFEFFMSAPTATIQEGITRTERFIAENEKIVCSISGGADSDCMLDLITKLNPCKYYDIRYVFFDTGIEMKATKEHIEYLQNGYDIPIETQKPTKSVPRACKLYGVPLLSKRVSEYLERLQRHDFKFEDRPFLDLYEEYPNCKAALRWWCNEWGEGSIMGIERHKKLKEYMVLNPPNFKISPKCCDCAKKNPAKIASANADITFIGLRKAEGGARMTTYKTCFIDGKHGKQHFPLFWWTDYDRQMYEKEFNIVHSKAYTEYGCTRTGCAGCPFGSHFEDELKMLDSFEPELALAARAIFGNSYEYIRGYRKFKK